jgi:hypothetical protein
MENKKLFPQIMKRSERGAIDKAVSSAVNYGDDAESILKRMYGDIPLDQLSDDQVYRLLDKASELTGHLGLEKHGISDADPKAVQKLIKKEYGHLSEAIPAFISEKDPEKFIKKFKKAQELGYVDESYLNNLLHGESMGLEIPSMDLDSRMLVPKAVLVSPQGSPLRQAGTGLHEFEHAQDEVMSGLHDSRSYDWDISQSRRDKKSPFDAIRSITKGHMPGRENFELEKSNELLRGVPSIDPKSASVIKKRAKDLTETIFGKGYGKVRAVAPFLGGAAGLAASAAAEAFDAEDAGEGSDLAMEDRASLSPLARTATDPSIANAARKEMQMREQFGTGEPVVNPDEGEDRRRMAARFAAVNALRNK